MDWKTVASGLFAFGWSIIFLYIARSIEGLRTSVASLDSHMAGTVEKVEGLDRRVDRLEMRVDAQ